ncbi:MAG: hypothetical protein ABL963_00900 [Longimicrobiales bacterium]
MVPKLARAVWASAALICALTACGGGAPTAAAPAGELTVTMNMRGNGTVSGGVAVRVGAQGAFQTRRVARDESVRLGVPPGDVQVSVSGLPDHCWADQSTVDVVVAEGTPAEVILEVTCIGDFVYRTERIDEVAYRGTDGSVRSYIYPGAVSILSWSPAGASVMVGAWPSWSPKCARSLFHVATRTVTPVGRPEFAYAWDRPAWSPTGDRMVLGRTRDCGDPNADVALMLYDATGTTALDSIPGLSAGALSWRPGTEQIAYRSGGQIRLHSWATGSDSLFANFDGDQTAWTPDASRVAVQLTSTGQIVVLNAGGQELFRLGGSGYMAFEPLWAPDGSGLLFSCVPSAPQNWDYCYASADGSGERAVTTQEGGDGDASWAADGDYFLYTSNRSGVVSVFLGNILGLPHRQIVRTSGSSEARFGPGASLGLD